MPAVGSRPSASASANRWSRPERPGWKSAASSTAPTRARRPFEILVAAAEHERATARSARRDRAASAASSSSRRRSARGSRSPSHARARTTGRPLRVRSPKRLLRCSAHTTAPSRDRLELRSNRISSHLCSALLLEWRPGDSPSAKSSRACLSEAVTDSYARGLGGQRSGDDKRRRRVSPPPVEQGVGSER